jgi:Holliday junction resolvase RusA-like endonuclease
MGTAGLRNPRCEPLAAAVSQPRASLLIHGHPAPKGSRAFLGNGRSKESSERCKPWVETVAYAARASRPQGEALAPPYEVELLFSMPEGKRPKYSWPTKDGDLDKLVRACLDGLTQGGLIVDDRHVIGLSAAKKFGTPGVSVAVF